jgi:diguanylate cyclase (GGDEF)-like protein
MSSQAPPPSQRIEDVLQGLESRRSLALRFPDPIEQEYHRARLPERLALYRIAVVLGIVLYNAFLVLDYFLLRQNFLECLAIRLGFNTPLALLLLFAAPRAPYRLRETLFAFSPLPASVSLLYIYNGSAEWIAGGQAALIIMMMGGTNALRPSFKHASVAVSLLTAIDAVFLLRSPWLDAPRVAMYASLVVTAAFLAMLACFQMDRQERMNYLLHLRNETQNAELSAINTELAHLSTIDPLTGVPNRRFFDAQLRAIWEQALHRRQPLSLLMIDLDHFKLLNDVHGHTYGDTALRRMGRTVRETLRGEHDIVARFGGEEFVALLPNQQLANAIPIAERLCAAVRAIELPPGCGGVEVHLSASIGIACATPSAGLRSIDLLRAADAALYKAKSSGRDRVFPAAA